MCVCVVNVGQAAVRVCIWLFDDFFFQAEDGIRYLVRSRGLGDVYKRQVKCGRDELQGTKLLVDAAL